MNERPHFRMRYNPAYYGWSVRTNQYDYLISIPTGRSINQIFRLSNEVFCLVKVEIA